MLLVVTGVGFLIHVYSIGYMHDDPGFWRFFRLHESVHLCHGEPDSCGQFSPDVPRLGGVGLCSYLLIGFWYDRKFEKGTTADAAKKAFIINRIGDSDF